MVGIRTICNISEKSCVRSRNLAHLTRIWFQKGYMEHKYSVIHPNLFDSSKTENSLPLDESMFSIFRSVIVNTVA